MSENGEKILKQRVEMLCARCDALAREIRKLHTENRKLRGNAERARQKIRDIIARLPETAELDGARPH